MQMKEYAGSMYMLSFSFFISISTVITHLLAKNLNPILIAFYTFSFAFLSVNLIQVKNIRVLSRKVIENWKIVLAANVSTAIDWILIFIALKYISGSLVNCFVFGIAPIATFILSIKSYLSKKLLIKDLIITCSICFMLLCLASLYYEHATQPLERNYLTLSIVLCVLSGFATSVTALTCKILYQRNFDALSVMKTRFVLLITSSLIIILVFNIQIYVAYKTLWVIILLALMFNILPSLLLQKGLEKNSAVSAVIISSSIPAMTYFLQLLDPRYSLEPIELALVMLLSLAIYFSIRINTSEANEKIS